MKIFFLSLNFIPMLEHNSAPKFFSFHHLCATSHGDAVVAGHRAHGANPVVEYVVVHAEEVTNLQEEEHGAISESAKDAENVTDPVATVNPGADPGESASD
jgi:hypothetical protein